MATDVPASTGRTNCRTAATGCSPWIERRGQLRWEKPLPIQVRAMILAGKVLFAAGPPAGTSVGPWDRGEGQPSLMLAVSAADGEVLAQTELPGVPLFDGLAAAGGRLYISLENGSVACLE